MSVFSPIVSAIESLFDPVRKIVTAVKTAVGHVLGIYSAAVKLKDSVLEEIDAWKNFKQDIRLKQRVVNLEIAIQKTRDLIEGIPAAWHSIVDIVKTVQANLKDTNPQSAVEDLEAELQEGADSIRTLLSKFPRLLKAFEKVLGVVAIVFTALERVADVVDDLQTIVDETKRIRLEIEKLDTIFLSQSNKRKTLKLADGSSIRIRVGSLHS